MIQSPATPMQAAIRKDRREWRRPMDAKENALFLFRRCFSHIFKVNRYPPYITGYDVNSIKKAR